MSRLLTLPRILVAMTVAFAGATTVGCTREPAKPTVTAGPMPAGATWQGVYFSKSKGELNVVLSDRRADGAWRTPDGIRGSLWGAIDGNTLHYMWSEQRTNERGEPIDWFGRGYFVYHVDGANQAISGEWGLDENETGNAWTAVKRLGQKPKLSGASDNDDSPDSDTQGGSTCYDCEEEQSPE